MTALTPAQCLEARRLLGMTRKQLAELSGLTETQIRGFETSGRSRRGSGSVDRLNRVVAIRAAVEQAGVVVLGNGEEPGVKLRQRKP